MSIYITATGKKDGVGSQILSKILAIIYCKKMNYEYIHSPLKQLDVKEQDLTGINMYKQKKGHIFVNSWENILNIGYNYKTINEINYDLKFDLTKLIQEKQITMEDNYLEHNFDPTDRINYYLKQYPNKNILFLIKEFPKFDKYEYNDYKDILQNLKNNSNLNKNILDKSKYHIVLHVRHTRDSYSRRTTINFKDLLENLLLKLNKNNIEISIISDGKKENFPEYEFISDNRAKLKNSNILINMYLQTDSLKSFNIMTQANILVLHASAFSYVAALFNNNTIIYPEFHDKPLKNWIIYKDNINII